VFDKAKDVTTPEGERTRFATGLEECIRVLNALRPIEALLHEASKSCIAALSGGNKLLVCGNGGSASEAQHLVGELVGRYKSDREPLAAASLTSDTTVMTCIGNDYSFDDTFSRQLKALGRPGDVLVVFSTSGNSRNILSALTTARERGIGSIAFLGRRGGAAAELADYSLIVPHEDTARIQEGHQFLMHALMDFIEAGNIHDR